MARGVARYLVGSLAVLGLAACGKMMFAERDAWRHEAEVACLKSGQVKENASLARIQPISGPGVCGADFPLKVAAIGEGAPIAFADDPRPPGAIPAYQPLAVPPPSVNYTPRPAYPDAYPQQQAQPFPGPRAYPPPPYPQTGAPNGPMTIGPGAHEPDDDDDADYESAQPSPGQTYPQRGAPMQAYPQAPRIGARAPYQPVPYEPAPDNRASTYSQPYPAQPAEQV